MLKDLTEKIALWFAAWFVTVFWKLLAGTGE